MPSYTATPVHHNIYDDIRTRVTIVGDDTAPRDAQWRKVSGIVDFVYTGDNHVYVTSDLPYRDGQPDNALNDPATQNPLRASVHVTRNPGETNPVVARDYVSIWGGFGAEPSDAAKRRVVDALVVAVRENWDAEANDAATVSSANGRLIAAQQKVEALEGDLLVARGEVQAAERQLRNACKAAGQS